MGQNGHTSMILNIVLFSDTTIPAPAASVIELLDLETGSRHRVTEPNQPDGGHGAPIFSPSGRFVVFATSRRSVSGLWAVDLENHRLIPKQGRLA